MGGKGSSSKRKSSKSKRDKKLSEKKSRRKESKKHRHNYDSDSSYSKDDPLNAVHSSSSTSESDPRRRISKTKKRRRDHSLSSYSSSDSDSLSNQNSVKRRKVKESQVGSKGTKKRVRKGSKSRVRVDKPIKKSSKRKPKKYSSSSSSSDSESGSTCQSSSSSDTAYDKRRRSKKNIDKVKKRVRDSESNKPHKKRKVRSPSISVSGQSASVSHGYEAVSPVNNFRRLKSVITVVNRPDEGEIPWERDPQKQEIVYDQYDYPSPKSVDSSEEVNELKKLKTDEINHQSKGAHMSIEKEKETDDPVPVAALGGDVLESILRQKALENLKKFKGRLQAGPRNTDLNNETHVNSSSPRTVDISLSKSTNTPEMDKIVKSDCSQPTEVEIFPDSEHVENEPRVVKQTTIVLSPNEDDCSDSQAVLAKCVSSNDNIPNNALSSSTVEPSSSAGLVPGESLEKKDEAKDGSEFEQKTMSVMRGGELVQVSYKVYIPKKALARRQLRR